MTIDKTITLTPEGNRLTLAGLRELVEAATEAGLPEDATVKVVLTWSGQGVRSVKVTPPTLGGQ